MTPERIKLIATIHYMAQVAKGRVLAPENVSKGDWSHLSTLSLLWMLCKELFEFLISLIGIGDSTEHEAGDVMVVLGMLLQRKGEK